MTAVEGFNPLTGVLRDDYYDVLGELRGSCPVLEVQPGLYYLAQHDDVSTAFIDYEALSNAWGPRLAGPMPREDLPIWELDPPRHAAVRRLALTALNPRAVATVEPFVVQVCEELVEAFASRGSADLVEELTVPLPSLVIAHMLGFPREDARRLRGWIDAMINAGMAPDGKKRVDGAPSGTELQEYVLALVARRRAHADPPDDIVTRMVQFKDEDGRTFTDAELYAQVRSLISAGNETTTHLIENLFYELISRPELYDQVRANRELVPAAVEETLRFYGPVQYIFRTANRDTEAAGRPVAAGEELILGVAAANRDESVYPHADEFRLDRGKNVAHLGFGRGLHLCVGASLARLEAVSALNTVLDRIPRLEFAPGFKPALTTYTQIRGYQRLDVQFPPVAPEVASG